MDPFSWLTQSPDSPMAQVVRRIQMVAPSPLPVVLLGETGVGKEVAARAIHETSARRGHPFIPVNCGALNPNLLEGALFGALRGAYTGSHQESKGMIRAAHGGTLFLDEIGELPIDAQSRLLRVLQERKVTPLGSHQEIPVDFRLVCATHRNLQHAVAQKAFREDLFFRIHAFPIRLSPLRERPADIIPIACHLWKCVAPAQGSFADISTYEERAAMIRFPWPGNVRQLKNVLERFALLTKFGANLRDMLQEETAAFVVHEDAAPYQALPQRRIHEPLKIQQALCACGLNRSRTARTLGISRGSLNYQIRKWGITTAVAS